MLTNLINIRKYNCTPYDQSNIRLMILSRNTDVLIPSFLFSFFCSKGRMRENCLVGRRNSWPVFFLIYGPFYVVKLCDTLQKGTFSLVRLEKCTH